MYSVGVQTHFWASHSVSLPDGSPEPVHSHNFCATAQVSSADLGDEAMVVDFIKLKKSLDDIASLLAGNQLSRIDYFARKGQTAEVIAEYIFEKIRQDLPLPNGITLNSVTVMEQPGCRATFSS